MFLIGIMDWKKCQICGGHVGVLTYLDGKRFDYWRDKGVCGACLRIVSFKQGVISDECYGCQKVLTYDENGQFSTRVKSCRKCQKIFCYSCWCFSVSVMCMDAVGDHELHQVGIRKNNKVENYATAG